MRILKLSTKPKLDKKYYKIDPNFELAENIDAGENDLSSKERISKEVFDKLNLPMLKELGSGVYASAFESFFAGKRVAVKVTQSESDFESYQNCKNVRESLGKYKKYMPKIYSTKQLQNYYVIISELLLPLPKDVENNLFDVYKSIFAKRNIKPDQIIKTIKDFVDFKCQKKSDTYSKVYLFINKHFNIFSSSILHVFNKMRDENTRWAVSSAKENINKLEKLFTDNELNTFLSLKDDFPIVYQDIISNINYEFSLDWRDASIALENSAEKQQIIDFLKFLESKSMDIDDIHEQNIMMRPNGELVISDLSFFSI